MRRFESGATRDTDEGKLDYESFFSPLVLKRRAEYMHEHRIQADGSLRPGDNWQKGIPPNEYMKSMFRHFMDAWTTHRAGNELGWDDGTQADMAYALCAIMFNAEGYLHELLKEK